MTVCVFAREKVGGGQCIYHHMHIVILIKLLCSFIVIYHVYGTWT